jgi:hypothetical protein
MPAGVWHYHQNTFFYIFIEVTLYFPTHQIAKDPFIDLFLHLYIFCANKTINILFLKKT